MTGNTNGEALGAEIRRQIVRRENLRALRALPMFQVDADLPDSLLARLRELENREAGRQRP